MRAAPSESKNCVHNGPGRFSGKPSIIIWCLLAWLAADRSAQARDEPDPCTRPAPGSAVPEPRDLRSRNGVLRVELSVHDYKEPDGSMHFCYLLADGTQAPTLRLNPGDLLLLHLKNNLVDRETDAAIDMPSHDPMMASMAATCGNGSMTALSTNLHFHGLTVPPVCHQDDVLKTSISPGAPPFLYRFRIPDDEPPGLYWYHPHIHGFSNAQVLGGASGALIIEGIERANQSLAGLPERVLIVRDQSQINPDAAPLNTTVNVPVLRDSEGDTLNTGNVFGKPAKDLS